MPLFSSAMQVMKPISAEFFLTYAASAKLFGWARIKSVHVLF
jgi:hypothetical protein